jgi:hypothetical protein
MRMHSKRVEQALARLEAAAARIEAAAARPAPSTTSASPDFALINRHEALKDTVAASLRDLDALIGRLER